MKNLFKDKKFFLEILTLVIPITLQNLISSSLNMVDNLMIGKLGENSIASVGLVNQYFFIFMLCLSGINAGAGIFISQFWGKKDVSNIRKMFGLEIVLSTVAALIFSILGFIFPGIIMNIFTKDAVVIDLGVKYLRIISITFIITGLTQGYSTLLRCVGVAKPPMFASLIGVLTNAFLNWILIFGNFGFPAMGVVGAAIATSIARTVEMVYVIYSAHKNNKAIFSNIKEIMSFNYEFVKIYFGTSSSVIINELLWSLGLTAYSIIYAKIGISAVASMQIATTINNMFMVLCIGIATAAVYFKLPLDNVFFIICLEEVIKIGFEAKRLHSKKWIGNVVEDLEILDTIQ